MALIDDLAKGATPQTVAIGIGAALLTPLLAPAMSSVLRPAAKAVLRTGIMLYRSAAEPIGAAVGGLVTEAQLELTADKAAPTSATSSRHKKPGGTYRYGTASEIAKSQAEN